MHFVDEIIVKTSRQHYRPQEHGKAEVGIVKDRISKRGRETNDNPHVAIGEIASPLSESAKTTPKNSYKCTQM